MRWLSFVFVLTFSVLALVVPIVRLRLRHGAWGIARPRDPVHRAMVQALISAVALFFVWSVCVGLLPSDALHIWSAPSVVTPIGAGLGVLGLLIVVVAQLGMGASWRIGVSDERTGLVTTGLFAHVRHPIYSGLFVMLGAIVLLTPSPWTVMGALWLGSLLALQARLEEAHLIRVYGDSFGSWAEQTGRFFPGLGRLEPT